jgi:hypothetical protein
VRGRGLWCCPQAGLSIRVTVCTQQLGLCFAL